MPIKNSTHSLFKILILILLTPIAWAGSDDSSVFGFWKTIDDATGEGKSVVKVYEKDGKLYGKIVDLLLKPDDTLCDKCKGDLKKVPVVGMDILYDLTQVDSKKGEPITYKGGEVLDPENGKFYDAKLWLEGPDTLMLRGYLGIFYRTQTWHRVEDPALVESAQADNSK